MTAPIASGWSGCRVGLAPTGKRRLSTAHANSGHSPIGAPNLAAPIASNRFFSSRGPGVSLMAESEHSVRVGARNVRRDQRCLVFWVANELQGVPMFYGLAVGVHLVDVDAGDPRILRVVIEEIQKVD